MQQRELSFALGPRTGSTVRLWVSGNMVFATTYLVDEDGIARERSLLYSKFRTLQEGVDGYDRQHYGLDSAESCVTERLTSNKDSTVKA